AWLEDKAQAFPALHADRAAFRDRTALAARRPVFARDVGHAVRTDIALRDACRADEDGRAAGPREAARGEREPRDEEEEPTRDERHGRDDDRIDREANEIGRASCRERV